MVENLKWNGVCDLVSDLREIKDDSGILRERAANRIQDLQLTLKHIADETFFKTDDARMKYARQVIKTLITQGE